MLEKQKKRVAAVSLAAVVGATPFAVALAVDAAHAAPPARMKGTITVATEQGALVRQGIRVSALELRPVDGVNQWVEVDYAFSGADGRYSVGKLVNGNYRLRFDDPTGTYATEFYDDAPRVADADNITLEGNNTVRDGLNAELGGAAHVTGRLTNNLGDALGGASVTVYVLDGAGWVPYQSVTSAADGSYDVGGLPAGEYTLGFSDPVSGATEYWNDKSSLAEAAKLALGSMSTASGLDASLDTGATRPQPPTPTVTATETTTSTSTATATTATTTTTTATPAPAPAPTIKVLTKPRIKGVTMVSRKLRVTKGAFSPSLVARKVQWFAGKKAIKGATRSRLKLTKALSGKRISVRVTVSVPGAKPVVVRSARTKRIRPAA